MLKPHIYCLFIFILFALKTGAVPAYPYPVTITQPDGTTLTIRLYGDESRKIRTTDDGYIIKQDTNGLYTYAVRDKDGLIVASDKLAQDSDKREQKDRNFLSDALKYTDLYKDVSQRPQKIKAVSSAPFYSGFPRTGSPRSLVILVNFKDVSFVTPGPQDAFDRLLNQENYSENGGTGSARDYFRVSSYGQFNPQFDVVGPFTLPQDMSYYGGNDAYGDDKRPAYMVVDACQAAKASGVDFSIYDTNGDGYVDNVFIYYAGYNEAEYGPESSIWPHRWAVQPGQNYLNLPTSVIFDGKIVYDYACTSELKGNTGSTMCGIGTFSHEFGHVIGMPDYYHTLEDKNTLNNWHIMDSGAYLNGGKTPPAYSAYDRFFLGWLTPGELRAPGNESLYPLVQSISAIENAEKQAYLLSAASHNLDGGNPVPREFYIMEYRQKTGWDAFLPAEGLLFWHIDYDQTAWENNGPNNYSGTTQTPESHMRVYLQPLEGYTTTPGTAFTSGSFTPLTWSGSDINRPISDITKTTDSISFKLMGGDPDLLPKMTSGEVKQSLEFPAIKKNTAVYKYLNIKTSDLRGDLSVALSGTDVAYFTVSVEQLERDAVNRLAGRDIHIGYKPLQAGTHNAFLTISGGGLNPELVIQLKGTCVE